MKKLSFEAIAKIDNNTAIAISADFNAVFRVNMTFGDSDYIGVVPEEEINESRLYTKAIFMNGKVYFVPSAAKNIAVYNVDDNSIYTLNIRKADSRKHIGYKNKWNFNGAVAYEKYIYLVPCTYPGIIRIDTSNDQLEYFDKWINGETYTFRKSVAVDGNEFYIPSAVNNLVLRFNMSTCNGKLYLVGKHNSGCWSMCKVGNEFWMAPKKQGPIVRWNPLTDIFEEFENYPSGFNGNSFLFTQIYFSRGKLYLIPAFANMGVTISPENGMIEKSNIPDSQSHSMIMIMFELDGYLYLKIKDKDVEQLLKINMIDNTKESYAFTFRNGLEEYHKVYEEALQKSNEITREQSFWGLEDFIYMIASVDSKN